MGFWDEKEAKRMFRELPFYKNPTDKSYIKRLNNTDMPRELPFYNELTVLKTLKVFKRYARSVLK